MMPKDTVAVVLAAGFGTRLRPSTERCPKPLIPVGGVEPLFFALFKAYQLGVRRAVVNAHYLHEKVEAALERWKPLLPGMEFRCAKELPEILGTGGALINIVQSNKDWFENSGILLQNGDTLAQINLGHVFPRGSTSDSSFAISFRSDHLKKYNPLWVSAEGEWAGIGKSAPVAGARPAHFLGVHTLSPSATKLMQSARDFEVRPIDLFNGVYRPLANAGLRFCSVAFFTEANAKDDKDFWFDMTTQEYLLEAQRHVLGLLGRHTVWDEVLKARFPKIREISPGVWVSGEKQSDKIDFRAPVVCVGARAAMNHMSLGPDAALILDSQSAPMPASRGCSMSNAVVFSSEPGPGATLPETVKDRICVL